MLNKLNFISFVIHSSVNIFCTNRKAGPDTVLKNVLKQVNDLHYKTNRLLKKLLNHPQMILTSAQA